MTATFEQLFSERIWQPIRKCPGRFVLRGNTEELSLGELIGDEVEYAIFCLPTTEDPVLVTPLEDGGLLSYAKQNRRFVHTLNTREGFERKTKQLGIELISAPTIWQVASSENLDHLRELFTEYEQELGIDLSFQHFDRERSSLPGLYAPPQGVLLLAKEQERNVGCVCAKPIDHHCCEMKRLYVRPASRKRGLGRRLSEILIAICGRIGYTEMRLHTLSRLNAACDLYRSIGFYEIPAYEDNPHHGALFLERQLVSC